MLYILQPLDDRRRVRVHDNPIGEDHVVGCFPDHSVTLVVFGLDREVGTVLCGVARAVHKLDGTVLVDFGVHSYLENDLHLVRRAFQIDRETCSREKHKKIHALYSRSLYNSIHWIHFLTQTLPLVQSLYNSTFYYWNIF